MSTVDKKILKEIGDFPEIRTNDIKKELAKELSNSALYGKDEHIAKYTKSKIKEKKLDKSKLIVGNRYDEYETYDSAREGVTKGKKFMSVSAQTSNMLVAMYSIFMNQIQPHLNKIKNIKNLITELEKEKSERASLALSVLTLYKKKPQPELDANDDLLKQLKNVTKLYIGDKNIMNDCIRAFVYFIQQVGTSAGDYMYHNKTTGNPKMILGMTDVVLKNSIGMKIDPATVQSVMMYVDSCITTKGEKNKKEPVMKDQIKLDKKSKTDSKKDSKASNKTSKKDVKTSKKEAKTSKKDTKKKNAKKDSDDESSSQSGSKSDEESDVSTGINDKSDESYKSDESDKSESSSDS